MKPEPVAASERLMIVDVLRGFALFGILCINILAFANPGSPPGFGFRGAWWDVGFFAGIITLVESKFFTLFSSLFGLGFALQLGSANKRGEDLVPRFRRRLLALFCFGVLHIVLLWDGDILLLYALVGFLLIGFRNTPPTRLLLWIRWLLAVPLVVYGLVLLGVTIASSLQALDAANREFGALFAAEVQKAAQKYATGSYGTLMGARLESYSASFVLLLTRIPTLLAMFLIGLYVGKIGILERPEAHQELLKKVRIWGWGLGLPLAALIAFGYLSLPPIAAIVVLLFNQALAGVLLSMAYASSLVLALSRAKIGGFARLVGNVGRMGLSNYLLQSLFCSLIFNGYGLGMAGKLLPWQIFGLTLLIYAAQMVYSTLWLRFFRFGLMEWLWRGITYQKWQPLR
jgi:uncharacterized protein